MSNETTLIFQHSRPGRSATAQAPKPVSEDQLSAIPASLRRKAQNHLAQSVSPARCYAPLLKWLEAPARMRGQASVQAEMASQLAELRRELRSVHGSATWRIGSRMHRMLARFRPPFGRG